MAHSHSTLRTAVGSFLREQGFAQAQGTLTGRGEVGETALWLKPVAGMTNAYLAVECGFGTFDYPPEYRPKAPIQLPSPGNPPVEYFSPRFYFFIYVTAVAHLLPEGLHKQVHFLEWEGKRTAFSELLSTRPFDLTDRVGTTIGVAAGEYFGARVQAAVTKALSGPLQDFAEDIDRRAWTLPGLVSMAWERPNGRHLSWRHCVGLLIFLAAAGQEFKPIAHRVAELMDSVPVSDFADHPAARTASLGTASRHTAPSGEVAFASAHTVLAALEKIYMGWLKLWYLVWIEEDVATLAEQIKPQPFLSTSTRARWRIFGAPAWRSSSKPVQPLDHKLPARLFEQWVAQQDTRLAWFNTWDVALAGPGVGGPSVSVPSVREVERQMLDSFIDFADFSQVDNAFTADVFITALAHAIVQRDPQAVLQQHPDAAWLHPGARLGNGLIIDFHQLCRDIFTAHTGGEVEKLLSY